MSSIRLARTKLVSVCLDPLWLLPHWVEDAPLGLKAHVIIYG